MEYRTKTRSFLLLNAFLFGVITALPHQSSHTNSPASKSVHNKGEARDTLISRDSDFVCPGHGVWPHPIRCELFYTCYSNEPAYLWNCRDDLLFDLRHQMCHHSEKTYCGDRLRPNSIRANLTINSAISSANSRNTDPNFTCPANGFFPLSPTACSTTFYNCVGGIAYIETCPGGGIFEPSQSTCVSSDQAECAQTTTMTTNPGPCIEDGFFPLHPEACCSEYVNCFAGVAYITTCPGGAVFDPNLRICVSAEAADCGFVCLTQDGFYDVPEECSNRYYSCVEGIAYESFCPGDAIFDPERLVCAAPESVACYLASTTTASTRETTVLSTVTPNENITTTTFSPPVEFVCPSDNGLYPNPDDCKTFYQCTGGKPYLKTCPNGLYFNPETLACDYLDNVPSCQV